MRLYDYASNGVRTIVQFFIDPELKTGAHHGEACRAGTQYRCHLLGGQKGDIEPDYHGKSIRKGHMMLENDHFYQSEICTCASLWRRRIVACPDPDPFALVSAE